MLIEQGHTYLVAFRKPWFVTVSMLRGWATERGVELIGYWPRGHANAPRVVPPNGQPHSHLVAGTMVGSSMWMDLTPEVAWVVDITRR